MTISFEILVPGSVTDPDPGNNWSTKSFVVGPPATDYQLKATALAYNHPTRTLTLTIVNTGTGIYPGVPGWTYKLTSSNPAGLSVVRAIPPIAAAGRMSPHVELVPAAFVPTMAGQTVTYTLTIFDDAGTAQGATPSCTFTVPNVPDLEAGLVSPSVPDSVAFRVANNSTTTNYQNGDGRMFAVYAFNPETGAEQEIEPPAPLPTILAGQVTPVGWLTRGGLKATYIPTRVGPKVPGGWSKFRFRLKLSPPGPIPGHDTKDDTVD